MVESHWSLLATIVVLPLISAFINGFFGKHIPKTFVLFLSCATILISAGIAVHLFSFILEHPGKYFYNLGTWISAGDLNIAARLSMDQLSGLMVCVITGVGFLIHLYSTVYMAEDPSLHRYFAYLNMFVSAMCILVLGDNLMLTFVGWEGVGLCSYLLIGFWFNDQEKASAGKKAFIVNRIGDFGFILGAITLFVFAGTFDFDALREWFTHSSQSLDLKVAVATVAGLFLFIGATGKSAQIPLYIWLPDAMAGPTPVSALIHAATMVTAGIYLICRLSFMFNMAPLVLAIIAVTGAVTAFFAATIGLVQTDIKKVLAYSTVSQLGYMFLGVGVGAFSAGFFHVFTHAFFKACLFLGSGAVIHALHHEQDIRKMGGLWKKLPVTTITFVISTLAIMGFPGLSGFFSKDEIMWQAFASGEGPHAQIFHGLNYLLYGLALATAAMTSFYMWRVTLLTFFSGSYRGKDHIYDHAHESPIMSFVLIVLAIMAVVVGYLNVPEILGGHARLSHFLEPVMGPLPHIEGDHHNLEWGLMGLTLLLAFASFGLAYSFFGKTLSEKQSKHLDQMPGHGLVKILYNKWYIDEFYQKVIIAPLFFVSDKLLFNLVDKFVIDTLFLGLFKYPARYGGYLFRFLQNGNVQRYALVFIAGMVVIFWMVL